MKKLALISLTAIAALVLFIACNKETNENKMNESSLKFISVKPNPTDVNAKPFAILHAGIYNRYLYIGVSYTGGNATHEFYVNWDGVVQETNTIKFIDLKVYHGNVTDDGTNLVTDSLLLDIGNLNISDELLSDKNLFFNLINTSDLSNVIIVPAYHDGGTPPNYPIQFQAEVRVVSQDCNKGDWGNLWLQGGHDTCYFPKTIESSIVYTPTLNDKLKIIYERTWLADSSNVCSSWQGKQVEIIDIKELTKIE